MADYFSHISFVVKCTEDQAKVLILAALSYEDRVTATDDPPAKPPTDELAKQVWKSQRDDGGSLGVAMSWREPDALWICDTDGSPSIEALVCLLELWMAKVGITEPIEIQWANTCSSPRIDAYGGGAVIVQPDQTEWMNTVQWSQDRLKAKASQRKVVIEVNGGVAECTAKPDDIDVEIIDHDNLEADGFDVIGEVGRTEAGGAS